MNNEQQQQQLFEVYLREYDKLKSEQTQRIGFRDNILYVTLGLFGGVLSFALSNKINYYAFLIIPWVCLILGWTYLVNDEKVSAIGAYIRYEIVEKVKNQIEFQDGKFQGLIDKIKQERGFQDTELILGWEVAHRSDKRRQRRKIQQLIIDEITFIVSGIAALLSFWFSVTNPPLILHILGVVELALLLVLGAEIIIYADLKKGR
jgi:hypothetical protein